MALRLVPAAFVVLGCDELRPMGPDAAAPDAQGTTTCDDGAPLPEALVGSFWLVPAGCVAASPDVGDTEWQRIGLLYVDRCGAAMTGIPDGYETHGAVRPEGSGHVYESENGFSADGGRFAFTIEVLDEQRAGAPVLALRSETSSEPWEAWAISRNVEILPPAPAPPRVSACAGRESWTTHVFSGSGPGALLASDEAPIAPGDGAPRLELGERYTHDLRITDPRLQLSTGEGHYEGAIVRWRDTGGEARFGAPNAACVELDGRVALEWDGETLVTEMDWLIVDRHDADGDGDDTELLVRRTRTDWRAGACP